MTVPPQPPVGSGVTYLAIAKEVTPERFGASPQLRAGARMRHHGEGGHSVLPAVAPARSPSLSASGGAESVLQVDRHRDVRQLVLRARRLRWPSPTALAGEDLAVQE